MEMKCSLKIFLNTVFSRIVSYMMIFYPVWLPGACLASGLQEPTATRSNSALYFHFTHTTADPSLNVGLG